MPETAPHLIDGKQIAEDIKTEISEAVTQLQAAGRQVPHLAAVPAAIVL